MPIGRAVVIRGSSARDVSAEALAEVLVIEDREVRDPGPGEVLVEVAAAGLNRADLLQRRGLYPAPPGAPADIPGLEFAGVVAATGVGAGEWAPGDRVMGITGGGAMARYLVAGHRQIVRVPDSLTLERAAAIPEAFITAYDALAPHGGLDLGATVLLHAVASGVGTAALQLAAASGARPIGTSRTPDKLARCHALGLPEGDALVVSEPPAFADRVRELTGGRGADVVLDPVGATYLGENARALAQRGRIVVIGLLGGATGQLPLALLMRKRAHIVGTVLRARPPEQKAAITQEFAARVVPLLAAGRVEPIVDDVLPMTEIAAAHARMERNDTVGKLVLRW